MGEENKYTAVYRVSQAGRKLEIATYINTVPASFKRLENPVKQSISA